MKFTIVIIKFLFIGALFIVSNNNLHLADKHDMSTFLSIYYSWMDNVFLNAKVLTGYVLKSEWVPSGNYSRSERVPTIELSKG